MTRRRSYDWAFPPADVPHILEKHGEGIIQDADINILLTHVEKGGLLSDDELDRLKDKGHTALSDTKKTTKLLQYTVRHGERGLRVLATALQKSGESAPHPGHTHWAQILEAELNASPEDKENSKTQKRHKEAKARKLTLGVKYDLREQEKTDKNLLPSLKSHAQLLPEDRSGINYTTFKLEIPKMESTDCVIDTMAAYNLFNYRDSSILVDLAQTFCRQPVCEQASDFEKLTSHT